MRHCVVLLLLVPFAFSLLTCLIRGRWQTVFGLLASAATAATFVFAACLIVSDGPQEYPLGGWWPPLGLRLQLDGLSLLPLGLTAVVGLGVSIYAVGYFQRERGLRSEAQIFWPLWLLLWGGLNGVFVSADVFNLYLLLEFTLLAAVALAALEGTAIAQVAALRYLLSASGAAVLYLIGVGLLYGTYSTVDLSLLAAAAPSGTAATAGLVLMTLALLLKCALFPFHFWLPPAHSSAPAPVSAVLSALVVKAAVYVVFRLWFEVQPALLAGVGATALSALGAAAILWGSWAALRQPRLKLVVAYSTVAQIGYFFLLFPLAREVPGDVIAAASYHLASHGLAKAAMFLGAGALAHTVGTDVLSQLRGGLRRAPLAVAAVFIGGAALAGALPGGGAKGKMLELTHQHGHPWLTMVIVAGLILAAAYTFRCVWWAGRWTGSDANGDSSRGLGAVALALGLAAVALSFFSDEVLQHVKA
jgi:multicomponent Na+:H+ antiporter subunit D